MTRNPLRRLRVVVVNLYVNNRRTPAALRAAHRRRPDVLLLVEARKRHDVIRRWANRHGYDMHHGPARTFGLPSHRGDRECVILTRSRLADRLDGVLSLEVADGIPGDKFAPPRDALAVLVAGVAVWVSHWHAQVVDGQGRPRGNTRATQHVEHSARLTEWLRTLEAAGYDTLGGGDANVPARGRSWSGSPWQVARRLGQAWKGRSVDGLMFDPEVWRVRRRRAFRVPGADHRGLLFVARRR